MEENFKNRPRLFTLLFYTLLKMYCYENNVRSLPISYIFHVMLLLVKVKFPSEVC